LFLCDIEQVKDEQNMLHATKEAEVYTVFSVDNREGKRIQEI
jgi:hypothetical protein